MTIYEKIDAFLTSLSLRDSLDQTAFSNKRSDTFLHCQRKLTNISSSPLWPGQQNRVTKILKVPIKTLCLNARSQDACVSSPHERDLKTTSTLGSTTRQQPSEGLYETRDWASTFSSLALESKLSAGGGSALRLKPLPFNMPVFYPNCTLFIT